MDTWTANGTVFVPAMAPAAYRPPFFAAPRSAPSNLYYYNQNPATSREMAIFAPPSRQMAPLGYFGRPAPPTNYYQNQNQLAPRSTEIRRQTSSLPAEYGLLGLLLWLPFIGLPSSILGLPMFAAGVPYGMLSSLGGFKSDPWIPDTQKMFESIGVAGGNKKNEVADVSLSSMTFLAYRTAVMSVVSTLVMAWNFGQSGVFAGRYMVDTLPYLALETFKATMPIVYKAVVMLPGFLIDTAIVVPKGVFKIVKFLAPELYQLAKELPELTWWITKKVPLWGWEVTKFTARETVRFVGWMPEIAVQLVRIVPTVVQYTIYFVPAMVRGAVEYIPVTMMFMLHEIPRALIAIMQSLPQFLGQTVTRRLLD